MVIVAATISIITLIIMMAVNKTFSALYKLMLQLQFFAYIYTWSFADDTSVKSVLLVIK